MTTRQFIEKCVAGGVKAGGKCSSVFFDGKHVYSYGYHYPLLVNVAGAWILNDAGYSNTTAKHINWAAGSVDYRLAIDPSLPEYGGLGDNDKVNAERLTKQAERDYYEFVKQLQNLRAGAFRKQEFLTSRIAELAKTINYLKTI